MPNKEKLAKSKYKLELEEMVRKCEAIRKDVKEPQDISLSEYLVLAKDGLTTEQLYDDLGLNPQVDTIQNIVNMPDTGLRWLIPEVFRDALRLGLRKSPIYPSLITGEQSVPQTTVTMPAINMSEAKPKKLGPAQTIQTGEVSFDQKQVKIQKYGRGIKVPYEVIQYVSLNLVSVFLSDFGVKLAMGIDTLAINTLLNGDQSNGSDSISVVGIQTPNDIVFRDLLKIWVRAGRLGKNFQNMVAGETMAIEILELLTNARTLGTPRVNVTVKTPIPQNANVFVHGAVPANQAIILDPTTTMIKLNAQPLLVESEKIVSNQTEATYATLTTGFATIFRDSRIALDLTRDFNGAYGFPTFMDPTTQEIINFDF
jgi:hypothetical protein